MNQEEAGEHRKPVIDQNIPPFPDRPSLQNIVQEGTIRTITGKRQEMNDMWRDFLAGDWYAFWTGGPVRNAIYQPMKRVIQWADRWFEALE